MKKLTVMCPCCETTLTVDAETGAILAHEEKAKKLGSFEDLRSDMNRQIEIREQLFAQEALKEKDRERLLEEKFQEAFKRADKDSTVPYRNPLDMD
jgi:hypothetical protein